MMRTPYDPAPEMGIAALGIDPKGDYLFVHVDENGFAILSPEDRELMQRIEGKINLLLRAIIEPAK